MIAVLVDFFHNMYEMIKAMICWAVKKLMCSCKKLVFQLLYNSTYIQIVKHHRRLTANKEIALPFQKLNYPQSLRLNQSSPYSTKFNLRKNFYCSKKVRVFSKNAVLLSLSVFLSVSIPLTLSLNSYHSQSRSSISVSIYNKIALFVISF